MTIFSNNIEIFQVLSNHYFMCTSTSKFRSRNRIWITYFNIFDFYTTYTAIQLGATEANPVMNLLLTYTGTLWSLLVIKIIVLSVVIIPYYTVERKKNVWKSTRMTWQGTTYSGISGSTFTCNYPELIAACHALHQIPSRDIHYTA